ncbi:MAG: hypothetical protein HYR76_02445 [Ignavibacteria bacterium]|nr:hypothetical protein [Ignavibacteria bacterium]MBI3766231.1 hypothetical protein [Ignavibacteriales bacterium]
MKAAVFLLEFIGRGTAACILQRVAMYHPLAGIPEVSSMQLEVCHLVR